MQFYRRRRRKRFPPFLTEIRQIRFSQILTSIRGEQMLRYKRYTRIAYLTVRHTARTSEYLRPSRMTYRSSVR